MKRVRSLFTGAAVAVALAACQQVAVEPMPETVDEAAVQLPEIATSSSAITAAGLREQLRNNGPVTFFAPSEQAWSALPDGLRDEIWRDPEVLAEIMGRHIAMGDYVIEDLRDGDVLPTIGGSSLEMTVTEAGVRVENADIIVADVMAGNGVIHVVNEVFLDDPDLTNVVETAAGIEDLETLVAAIETAGLVEDLANGGPFTIFAPVDAAFRNLPEGQLDALLGDPEALAQVLQLHVAAEEILAADLEDGQQVTTLLGVPLTVALGGHLPRIDGAEIIETDFVASNGVIHLIDRVLQPPPSIVGILREWRLEKILALVEQSDWLDSLSEEGPFTLFAPSDRAFKYQSDGFVDSLLADPVALSGFIARHVVSGTVLSSDLTNGELLQPLNGRPFHVTVIPNDVKLNGVEIVAADKNAINGVVHVVEDLLLPPPPFLDVARADKRLSKLVEAIEMAGLADQMIEGGPFTVFAPTDAAFAWPPEELDSLLADPALAAEVVTFHVVEGIVTSYDIEDGMELTTLQGGTLTLSVDEYEVRVNDVAEIDDFDIFMSTGVIHLIDAVLIPPPSDDEPTGPNIIETLAADVTFSTLVGTLEAAGLIDTLTTPGPFTLFAPSNEAFVALDPTVLAELLADPTGALANVLAFHVVEGNLTSADLMDGMVLTTLQEGELTVSVTVDGVFVNGVQVEEADITASNGVIHRIGAVLLPPSS